MLPINIVQGSHAKDANQFVMKQYEKRADLAGVQTRELAFSR